MAINELIKTATPDVKRALEVYADSGSKQSWKHLVTVVKRDMPLSWQMRFSTWLAIESDVQA